MWITEGPVPQAKLLNSLERIDFMNYIPSRIFVRGKIYQAVDKLMLDGTTISNIVCFERKKDTEVILFLKFT
jgi:hypothetical protein